MPPAPPPLSSENRAGPRWYPSRTEIAQSSTPPTPSCSGLVCQQVTYSNAFESRRTTTTWVSRRSVGLVPCLEVSPWGPSYQRSREGQHIHTHACREEFDGIQHPFMFSWNSPQNTNRTEIPPPKKHRLKARPRKPATNIIQNGESLVCPPSQAPNSGEGSGQGVLLPAALCTFLLGVLASATQQEKEIKGLRDWRGRNQTSLRHRTHDCLPRKPQ